VCFDLSFIGPWPIKVQQFSVVSASIFVQIQTSFPTKKYLRRGNQKDAISFRDGSQQNAADDGGKG
jgi:hypothetical protein